MESLIPASFKLVIELAGQLIPLTLVNQSRPSAIFHRPQHLSSPKPLLQNIRNSDGTNDASPPPLTFSFFLLLLGSAVARHRHVIPLNSATDLRPSSLAWDPFSQHFLIGSRHRPVISFVSDAGIVQTLIPKGPGTTTTTSSVEAVAINHSRRRLIAAFFSPPTISAYDLWSPIPHPLLFSSPLSDSCASITGADVDPTTGIVFVTTSSGQIFIADLDGKLSTLAQVSGQIEGVAHVNRGHLLVVEIGKGGLLKVDPDDGVTKRVLISAPEATAETVAVRSDGEAVVAGGAAWRWMKSEGGWAEASVYDEFRVEQRERIAGATIRDGRRAYVLVVVEEEGHNGKIGGRIEEVEWGREGEGEMVGAMVMVGLGLAYFMYWRFQMGKLVTGINKKRA